MKVFFKNLRRNVKHMDKMLLFLSISMFIFGLLNIVTASSREAVVRYEASLYYYFFQQLKMLIIGFAASIVLIQIDTKYYHKLGKFAFFGCLFLTIYLSLTGTSHKGAVNWLSIFGFSFQPSELSKVVIIVCVSLLFERFSKKLRNNKIKHTDMIAIILFVGLFIPVLVFLQRDLGTMMIMVACFAVLFFASPILRKDKFYTILIMCGLVLVCGLLLYVKNGSILSESQMERFNYFYPCSEYNYAHGGYQICNGFIALNSGGLFGLGIGKSQQKYSYIPEPHTDSVFAIIGEEYGVLRSSLVFIAYILILWRILYISSTAHTMRGRYICLGFAVYIFSHIFVNLGGLFGLIPLTGVPLPFLSYGGTFAICLCCALTVVQRVYVESSLEKERQKTIL